MREEEPERKREKQIGGREGSKGRQMLAMAIEGPSRPPELHPPLREENYERDRERRGREMDGGEDREAAGELSRSSDCQNRLHDICRSKQG